MGDWRTEALCIGVVPMFFPEGGHGLDAKAICAVCPVRQPCGDYALDHHEIYGIWGGMSEKERRREWRRRAIARRKSLQP